MENFKRRLVEIEQREGVRLVDVRRAVNSCLSGGGRKSGVALREHIQREEAKASSVPRHCSKDTHGHV